MNVSTDPPAGDWLRKRTLHHYPHDARGRKLGIAAFAIVCVMAVVLCVGFFIDRELVRAWLGLVMVFGIIASNALGVFSQMLTGGRCWHGAVAMASAWGCVFVYVIILMS